MKRIILVALCLGCGSCKLRFTESVSCENGYQAGMVYAYKWDSATLVVLHPDKTFDLVPAAFCIVEGGGVK
jgi:MinD superfamily P-loop ATPase